MLRRVAFLAVAGSALALPATASAGTLTLPGTCFEQGSFTNLAGTGFTPIFALAISNDGVGSTTFPDDDGAFEEHQIGVPAHNSFTPRTVTVTATDQRNAANNASLAYSVVRYGSNMPVTGRRPGQKVTWQFGGFPAGSTVYGHFRFRNRTLRNYRFGTATGPCGVLSVKAKRIPVKKPKRKGGWYVQIDTNPRFDFNTRPEYDKSFALR